MDYSHMTVTELRKIAKEKGVAKATSLKKQELLDALTAMEAALDSTENTASEDLAEVKAAESSTENEEPVKTDDPETSADITESGETQDETGAGVSTVAENEKNGETSSNGEQNQRREGPGQFHRGDTK